MKIVLTPQESEEIFFSSLCNAYATGYMNSYGLELRWHKESYIQAKQRIEERGKSPCVEEILLEMLRGGGQLTFFDIEGGEESWSINLQDVHDKVCNAPARNILNFIEEQDDAEDADVILQTVFMGEIMFG